MRLERDRLRLAASDITTFASCAHATALDRAIASGSRQRPPLHLDPAADLLRLRADEHEAAYLANLKTTCRVEEVPVHGSDASARTFDAMRRGVAYIYRGVLHGGARWAGGPGFLRRVERPSSLGAWSYEALDAKLSWAPKPEAILQLCLYSDLLAQTQGTHPRRMGLVLGDLREQSFDTTTYASYFRRVRRGLEEALAFASETYPDPVAHCDVCEFSRECDERRRADDHLSLVAGITSSQRRALYLGSLRTVADLAGAPLARPSPVAGIGHTTFARIREQARVQVEGRDVRALLYELLPAQRDNVGLASLPSPSPGDLFIDLEGCPLVDGKGIEFLFGLVEPSAEGPDRAPYRGLWAFDREGERAAFERFMSFVMGRRTQHPDMHLYHYDQYEPTALKRLAGRYATCVDDLDVLLRGGVFVDLYRAVRQALRASVESYSIECLEPLFGYERRVSLGDASRCLAALEAWLEQRSMAASEDPVCAVVEGYNRDACLSAMHLRDWLEERRRDLVRSGTAAPRPPLLPGTASDDLTEQVDRMRDVADALLRDVPQDPARRSSDQRARAVLAHLLDWHRREDKSAYWEYLRLCDMSDEDLEQDGTALGGLTYEGIVGKELRSFVHRYRFPTQDHALRKGMRVHDPRTQKAAGTVVAIDDDAGSLDLRREESSKVPHPTAVIPERPRGNEDQRASLLRLGEHVAGGGLSAVKPFSAAVALLRCEWPLPSEDGATVEETAVRRALAVDGSMLAVQGPPGAGKTRDGARMIVALVRAGKRVGITANSPEVIGSLLLAACEAAREVGTRLRVIQKKDDEDGAADPMVRVTDDSGEVLRALSSGEANLAAGTAWLWSREGMVGTVDVLFVDEAGQMALADVLACAPASNGLVLLGDPQQLDQPTKGVHPEGAAVSALGHVLGDRRTMDPERGLFLEQTWRMHPDVCGFLSEAFYEGRLQARPDLARIRLDAPEPLGGTGLRFLPVEHSGNQSTSAEEVEMVARLVQTLVEGGSSWTDRDGVTHALGIEDVLVVAPYSAQVGMLRRRLPRARVGTVDRFQGQQAPVVVYSMATSTSEDAPRGVEFLYSPNRFNVALSRARCAAFLVASPSLFQMRCKSERQMALANIFCRYLEVAKVVRA